MKLYKIPRIVLIYLFFSALWILFSDRLLDKLITDHPLNLIIQSVKGWFYILICAALLYIELIRINRKILLSNSKGTRYSTLFENMASAFAYIRLIEDRNGKPKDFEVMEVNSAFETITGFKRNNIIGQKITEITMNNKKNLYIPWLDIIHQVSNDLICVKREEYDQVLRKWISLTIYSTEKGYVAIIFDDITARKEAEASLKLSEKKFSAIFHNAVDAIAITDMDGIYVDMNSAYCRMSGYTKKEMIGKGYPELNLWTNTADRLHYFQTLKNHPYVKMEFGAIRKDSSEIICNISASKIELTGEEYILLLARDVTDKKAIENAIREKNAQLEALIESLPMVFWMQDKNGRYTMQNRKGEKIWGNLIGKKTEDLPDSNTLKNIWLENNRRVFKGETIYTEHELKNPDGNRYYWEAISPVHYSDNTTGIMGLSMDITGRILEQKKIKELSKEQQIIFDSVPAAIWYKDTHNRHIRVNKAAATQVKMKIEEIEGHTAEEIFPEFAAAFYADDLEVIRTGKPKLAIIEQINRADGKKLWLHTDKLPYIDESGSILGIIAISTDITERRKAEQELEKTRALLLSAIEQTPAGIMIAEKEDDRSQIVNSAALEILGNTENLAASIRADSTNSSWRWYKTDNTPYESNDLPLIRSLLYGTVTRDMEMKIIRSDGGERWILANSAPVYNNHNERIAGVLVFTDVTRRKQEIEEMRTSLEEKEVLLKEIHHRVKNNLQVISSLLHLQERYIVDPKDLEIFKDSQNRIRSMAMIHEKLYQSSSLSEISFYNYIQNLTYSLYTSYGIHPDKVKLQLDADDISFNIDTAIPCGLLLNELISNCFKHSFPGDRTGTLRIIFMRLDGKDTVRLQVRDDGVGLPENFSLENAETLGMKLIQTLSTQLGGNMKLENQGGAVFTLDFSIKPVAY